MSRRSATDIVQGMLDRTGHALMTADFAMMAPCFHFPQILRTYEAATVIETEAEFEMTFRRVIQHYRELQVTDLIRVVVSAEFDGPDIVKGTYLSHLMRGDDYAKDPYPCYGVCHRINGAWKIMSTDYAVEPGSRQSLALTPKPGARPTLH